MSRGFWNLAEGQICHFPEIPFSKTWPLYSVETIMGMPALDASDPQVRGYVCRYYWRLMTPKERLAYRQLFGTMKATHGRSDASAQQEARNSKPQLRELFSDDPEVLHLASAGMEAFLEKTATRMLAEHRDEIVLNQCPKCGALARTPNARQCRSCHHDWHDPTEYP